MNIFDYPGECPAPGSLSGGRPEQVSLRDGSCRLWLRPVDRPQMGTGGRRYVLGELSPEKAGAAISEHRRVFTS